MVKKKIDDPMRSEQTKHLQFSKSELIEDESLTGDMTALESDDDVTDNVHDMGLYKADDGEHPQELNLAGEVQKAENNRRGLD